MEPTHQDIYNHLDSLEERINQHDVRLARMEEKQNSIRDNIGSIMSRIDRLEGTTKDILGLAKSNEQTSKLLLKIAIIAIPVVFSMELWNRVT